MMTLQFADTHNLIAFLAKPAESKGFEQIVDFLNAHTINTVTSPSKLEEDKETAELQSLIEVVPNKEEVAIDAILLATKPPSIVGWKIHKEGKKIC
ncbi:hypothetical protein Tco_0944586 [Tanacetum coccineum]